MEENYDIMLDLNGQKFWVLAGMGLMNQWEGAGLCSSAELGSDA